MSQEEKLKKIIEKAVGNGWNDPTETLFIKNWPKTHEAIQLDFCKQILGNLKWVALIFSHDFAKAYFGNEWVCKECGTWSSLPFKANSKDKCDGSKCLKNKWEKIEVIKGSGKYYNNKLFLKWQEASDRMIYRWQYHLQQAVISDDPIEYYYKHLSENTNET